MKHVCGVEAVLWWLTARSSLRAQRALDKEVAITSTPSSVRLVSGLCIERVDGIEIVLGLLRGVQIYEPNEVRIKTRTNATAGATAVGRGLI